jgi:raffinose/stachyose/melibiose transport system permease protein
MKKNAVAGAVTYTILLAGLVLIIIPFYLTLVSAFKNSNELLGNFFGPPSGLYLENFAAIFAKKDYFYAVFNSFQITATGLVLCAVCLPMAAYPIARRMHSNRLFKGLFLFMISGIFVPFIVRMLPMIKLLNAWGFANKFGLILIYLGGATCEGVFLITGYLATVPTELEEAAYIDGASTRTVFFRIVYPVIRPIVATVVIKNGLWFWNDFLLPNLLLRTPKERTLMLFQYNFRGEHATDYPLVFACFLLSMLPILIFYFFMQKNIIAGLISGSVKG